MLARTPLPVKPRNPLELPLAMPSRRAREMTPGGNGTFDKEQAGWRGKVGRDGRVTFTDKPSVRLEHFGPCLSCMASSLRAWAKDPEAYAKGQPADRPVTAPGIGGSFDVTDWLMRRTKQDPYSYLKARFLDRTRAERMRMATVEKGENLRHALFRLRRNLRAVWTSATWPAARRRQLLFELWDECAETGSAEVLAVATRARATIIAFVRRNLPAGSAHAYTGSELKRLNRSRKSSEMFLPYER